LFVQRIMTETELKRQREAVFTEQHTISPEQFKKLIQEKTERARMYSNTVMRKRETVLQNDYR
jgi:hypothetical protein